MNAHAYSIAEASGDDAGAWLKILSKYRQPHSGRSVFELLVTSFPFAAFWAGANIIWKAPIKERASVLYFRK